MGLTPLEGLVMGTRSGDLDPSILEYLSHKEGLSLTEIDGLLNKQSGLLGLSGLTNDMRELLDEEKEHQDRRASLAVDVFCKRARKYIGAYLAELGGTDALIFAGGIGENSAAIRKRICEGLEWIGVSLDSGKNTKTIGGKEGPIHAQNSRIAVFVVPTNEELLIARDTVRCVQDAPRKF
jgi:acetate kinase